MKMIYFVGCGCGCVCVSFSTVIHPHPHFIQHRFDVMLSQSEIFYPSFVAALLDIVLSKREQIQISAQFISASTIASHLESVGILTIEYFIRFTEINQQIKYLTFYILSNLYFSIFLI